MDASVTPDGALPYTEHNVTALLNSQGGRLYRYFWVMLGEETAVTRALAGTIIVALPYPEHRELFEIARTVCRQHRLAPAMPYARAEAPTLAAVTKAALRRLEPDDREICVLGASAYRLDDEDLAAVLGTWAVDRLWSRAMDAFAVQLAACAAEAGLEQAEGLAERALRLFGAGQFALPYDEIVMLATDPAAQWLRDGIRARVGESAGAAATRQGGMEQLGTGSLSSVMVQGMEDAERMTVPLPRVPRNSGHHGSHRRRGVLAGGVLAAGAIPVAFAVALAGHSSQPGHDSAVPPLSAAGGSPVHGAAPSQARGPANQPGQPVGRHARPEPGVPPAQTYGTGTSPYMSSTGTTGTTTTGTTTTGTTTTGTKTTGTTGTTTTGTTGTTTTGTTAPPPVTTQPPPPVTTPPPPPVTTPVITHGNGNGNANGVGNGNMGAGNGNGNASS